MIATSLKPLSETLKYPERIADVFVGTGHRCTIDAELTEVVLEREVRPTPEEPVFIVRPRETFAAGEMRLPALPGVGDKIEMPSP